jgi:hypothetical protein
VSTTIWPPDCTTMPWTGGEAEPGPLPLRLRGEERLEQVLDDLLRHPKAGVAHAERHVSTWLQPPEPMLQRRMLVDAFRAHHDAPAVRHRVARVEHEVHQHLLDLPLHRRISKRALARARSGA